MMAVANTSPAPKEIPIMKKIMLLLVLIVASAATFAQTGLFELSYGDSFEDCQAILESKGFSNNKIGRAHV